MGDYKIEILATGGHGCDRTAKEGESLGPAKVEHLNQCPDCKLAAFIVELGGSYAVKSATLTHWPGDPTEVVDDMLARKRLKGQF